MGHGSHPMSKAKFWMRRRKTLVLTVPIFSTANSVSGVVESRASFMIRP